MVKIALTTSILFLLLNVALIPQEIAKSAMQDFLLKLSPQVSQASTFRRMEARNSKGELSAWLDVETELLEKSFTYKILKEGGRGIIRNKVFKGILEGEKNKALRNTPDESRFNNLNYNFPRERDLGEMLEITLKPKQKAEFLIDGIVYLNVKRELVRSEGMLVKNPSFWTSNVMVIMTYTQIMGVRVPISYESTAKVKFFGDWTISVDYKYTSINGKPVTETQ